PIRCPSLLLLPRPEADPADRRQHDEDGDGDEVRQPAEVVPLEEVGLRLHGPERPQGAEDAADAEAHGAPQPEGGVLAQALQGFECLLLGIGDDQVDEFPGVAARVLRLRFRVVHHGDTVLPAQRCGCGPGQAASKATSRSCSSRPAASLGLPLTRRVNESSRRPSTKPARPLTPSSEPVLARTLPSSGVSTRRGASVPDRPATARSGSSLGAPLRSGRRSTAARAEQGTWLVLSRPEPSPSTMPAVGSPAAARAAITAFTPAAVEPSWAFTTPSSRVRSSAAVLSLSESIPATISDSGAERTVAIVTAFPGAMPDAGGPLTAMASSPARRVSSPAAWRAGSAACLATG